MNIKPLDFVSIAVAAGALAASVLFAVQPGRGGDPEVVVKTSKSEYVYPLKENRELSFEGPIGTTYVEVKDGAVRVAKDPGPQQICVIQGWIHSPGQWLICLPNRVMVEIQGGASKSDVDALSF